MMVADPEYVKRKYNLTMLREIENIVAEAVEISVPLCVWPGLYDHYASPHYIEIVALTFLIATTTSLDSARSRTRLVFTPRRSSPTLPRTRF